MRKLRPSKDEGFVQSYRMQKWQRRDSNWSRPQSPLSCPRSAGLDWEAGVGAILNAKRGHAGRTNQPAHSPSQGTAALPLQATVSRRESRLCVVRHCSFFQRSWKYGYLCEISQLKNCHQLIKTFSKSYVRKKWKTHHISAHPLPTCLWPLLRARKIDWCHRLNRHSIGSVCLACNVEKDAVCESGLSEQECYNPLVMSATGIGWMRDSIYVTSLLWLD